MATSEPFPLLSTSADLHSAADHGAASAARRRRQSSGLGSELRVGDTGAPGLATSIAHLHQGGKVRLCSESEERITNPCGGDAQN